MTLDGFLSQLGYLNILHSDVSIILPTLLASVDHSVSDSTLVCCCCFCCW